MCCIEKKIETFLGLFGAPWWFGTQGIVPPRYAPGVTLRNKVHSCEIRRALKVEPVLPNSEITTTLVRPCVPNAHERLVRQVLLAKSTGKQPRGCPKPRWNNCISDLAWSHLGVEPAELSEIAVDCEVFKILLEPICSVTLPRWKASMRMNDIYLILFIHGCLSACLVSEQITRWLELRNVRDG